MIPPRYGQKNNIPDLVFRLLTTRPSSFSPHHAHTIKYPRRLRQFMRIDVQCYEWGWTNKQQVGYNNKQQVTHDFASFRDYRSLLAKTKQLRPFDGLPAKDGRIASPPPCFTTHFLVILTHFFGRTTWWSWCTTRMAKWATNNFKRSVIVPPTQVVLCMREQERAPPHSVRTCSSLQNIAIDLQ